jgi:hypothetical protein
LNSDGRPRHHLTPLADIQPPPAKPVRGKGVADEQYGEAQGCLRRTVADREHRQGGEAVALDRRCVQRGRRLACSAR